MKQPSIWPEVQQGAVERAATAAAFPLGDSNDRVDASLATGGSQRLSDFARDFNSFFVESLPLITSVLAALSDNHAEAQATRVSGNVRLRKQNKPGSGRG